MPYIPTATLTQSEDFTRLFDVTLEADAASFDVQNIPAAYSHLKIIAQLRGTQAVAAVLTHIRFNNDSGANYDYQYNSSSSTSNNALGVAAATFGYLGDAPAASATASHANSLESTIANYAGTTFHKFAASLCGLTTGTTVSTFFAQKTMSHWRSTSAIDRITILPSAGNWLAGSRLTIYGLS